ncbi:MAG: acyl carrier protein [Clostridia bacterium]|nr:acyl carrier protein [Clostridia bacterium]MBQ3495079.1 acyl carrier protein [Clostridia bacterium]MBQ4586643.1 acyl carrier protein [Clostridia bacterium]MBQ6883490.1 acyl carrier protein [Clostridia bacterium]MBR2933241.1 acyl carrier protein [Clostridia bacterium]
MTFDKIKALLANQLNIDESRITLESKIIEDLGADSLDIVELLMALEDETNITIPEDKVSSIKTVGDIINLIENN